ncbi:MAG: hypothetical protein FIA95_14700 [Gemmatimonadetes bacterium]|nr:hypothetical protein [Gemmatimonadota bacterium]
MPVGKYAFSTGVSAFFEIATRDALGVLPGYLQPIEVRHQRSVLSVTAFLFEDSVVGPYTELMFAIVVPAMVESWGHHAKAGFYPFLVATSSAEARRLRSERYHFPYSDVNIDAQFIETPGRLRFRAWGGGAPIVDFSVTQGAWESTSHLLQGFSGSGTSRYRANVQISGEYTVHENERGTMILYPHELTRALLPSEVAPYPFREHWLKNGTEVFHSLETF